MTLNVKFHPNAETEAMEAKGWYEERSAIAARAFAAELAWAIGEIQDAPFRWKRHLRGTRRFFLPNFPFSVVYREADGSIEIVAVAHNRRHPGYSLAR